MQWHCLLSALTVEPTMVIGVQGFCMSTKVHEAKHSERHAVLHVPWWQLDGIQKVV
jgi:hypothetical protein